MCCCLHISLTYAMQGYTERTEHHLRDDRGLPLQILFILYCYNFSLMYSFCLSTAHDTHTIIKKYRNICIGVFYNDFNINFFVPSFAWRSTCPHIVCLFEETKEENHYKEERWYKLVLCHAAFKRILTVPVVVALSFWMSIFRIIRTLIVLYKCSL